MTRRLCSLVALGALLLSSGCCWHRHHCCHRPILFPRMRGAYYESGCCSECGCPTCSGCATCATCGHAPEFIGPPVAITSEPAMAPAPMPRATPMKLVN